VSPEHVTTVMPYARMLVCCLATLAFLCSLSQSVCLLSSSLQKGTNSLCFNVHQTSIASISMSMSHYSHYSLRQVSVGNKEKILTTFTDTE
jgi:hypothetical protein